MTKRYKLERVEPFIPLIDCLEWRTGQNYRQKESREIMQH